MVKIIIIATTWIAAAYVVAEAKHLYAPGVRIDPQQIVGYRKNG